MLVNPVMTIFRVLTWCCVIALAVLSLLPAQELADLSLLPALEMARTRLSPRRRCRLFAGAARGGDRRSDRPLRHQEAVLPRNNSEAVPALLAMPDRTTKRPGNQNRILTIDKGRFSVCGARLAPAMISTPGHRASRRRQRGACQPGRPASLTRRNRPPVKFR